MDLEAMDAFALALESTGEEQTVLFALADRYCTVAELEGQAAANEMARAAEADAPGLPAEMLASAATEFICPSIGEPGRPE